MSERKMSFFGSPWSAPAWMKNNNNLTGKGSLIGEPGNKYHQTWALYFARWVKSIQFAFAAVLYYVFDCILGCGGEEIEPPTGDTL